MSKIGDWVVAVLGVSMIFVLLAFVGFMGWKTYEVTTAPFPEPRYYSGEYVKSTISGQRGQVVRTYCYKGAASCSYSVRFIGLSITTNTSVLGPDGPVSTEPLALVELQEFELIEDGK